MTHVDIALVQGSFRKIAPLAEQAAALFYARLFELDPAVRGQFGGNMHDQGRTLMALLNAAVASLSDLESLLPSIRTLGVRLCGQGAFEEHYASFGAALLWTLQKGLGPEFTPAVRAAWTNAYSLVAHTLIEAQRRARSAA